MLALGLQPGDRIGIFGTNSLEWAISSLATSKAGLISVSHFEILIRFHINIKMNRCSISVGQYKSLESNSWIKTLFKDCWRKSINDRRKIKISKSNWNGADHSEGESEYWWEYTGSCNSIFGRKVSVSIGI